MVTQTPGYLKLDKQKENAIWHMLKNENLPSKSLSNHEKAIKETVSAFKVKKQPIRVLSFLKKFKRDFHIPHFYLQQKIAIKVKKKTICFIEY